MRLVLFTVLISMLSWACSPQAPSQGGGEADPVGGPGQEGGKVVEGSQPPPAIEDLGSLGSAARDLLRPQPFTSLRIEIASVAERAPARSTVDHLQRVLSGVSGKPVTIDSYSIPAGDGSYSAAEIRDLSERHRKNRSVAPAAVIWIGYLDGELSENDDALGAAVAATVAAVFPDKIAGVSALISPHPVERAVSTHELGHLLALVNIGYQSQLDHEDPQHPNHSKNRSSVMYWAVEDLSIANVFRGGPPDDFDEADRADLKMLAQS